MRYKFILGLVWVILLLGVLADSTEATESPEPYGTLEAGLIEWGPGYIKAEEGFQLKFDGKWMQGDYLYVDSNTEVASLYEIDFSACLSEQPHYVIYAEKLSVFPEERLVFEGAEIKFGTIVFPVPFPLILNYREGKYEFPDWIPKLFYSVEKGIGIQLDGEYLLNAGQIAVTALVSSRAGLEGNIGGIYYLTSDVHLSNLLSYKENWKNQMQLTWRKDQKGFGAKLLWDWIQDGQNDREVSFKYSRNRWETLLGASYDINDVITPLFQLNLYQQKLDLFDYSFSIGVTQVTDEKKTKGYAKVKLAYLVKDEYVVDRLKIGWKISPVHSWVEEYGTSNRAKFDLWTLIPVVKDLTLKTQYEISDRWGAILPTTFDEFVKEENFIFEVNYNKRNEFNEGWSLSLSTKYDMLANSVVSSEVSIVRALDCQDWTVDLDLINPSAKFGMMFKY